MLGVEEGPRARGDRAMRAERADVPGPAPGRRTPKPFAGRQWIDAYRRVPREGMEAHKRALSDNT